MYHRSAMSAFSERHYFFWFVYIHEGMTCGLVCKKVLTCALVCGKALRNTLFESQGESQGTTNRQDPPYTFCVAIAPSSNKMKLAQMYGLSPTIFFSRTDWFENLSF